MGVFFFETNLDGCNFFEKLSPNADANAHDIFQI
jgi:hypothetical protein